MNGFFSSCAFGAQAAAAVALVTGGALSAPASCSSYLVKAWRPEAPTTVPYTPLLSLASTEDGVILPYAGKGVGGGQIDTYM